MSISVEKNTLLDGSYRIVCAVCVFVKQMDWTWLCVRDDRFSVSFPSFFLSCNGMIGHVFAFFR